MQRFEFKVVPAPRRGEKAKGVKTTEDRFALALTSLMNQLGAEGWDYVRADALPVDERAGLTGTKTTYQNMLVFRRVLGESVAPAIAPLSPVLTAPIAAPVVAAVAAPLAEPVIEVERPKLGAAVSPEGPAPAVGPAKSE